MGSYQKYVADAAVCFVSSFEVLQWVFHKVFWGQSHRVGRLVSCHSSGDPKRSHGLREQQKESVVARYPGSEGKKPPFYSPLESQYLYDNAFGFVFSLEALGKSFYKHLEHQELEHQAIRGCGFDKSRDAVLTLDAAYRVYRGNGIQAMPDEIFTITPFPLEQQRQRKKDCGLAFVARNSMLISLLWFYRIAHYI